jgi:hypothetical protein
VNVDRVLQALNDQGVRYLLIGGMNFLLRHRPVLTFDVDVWVAPEAGNLLCTERALADLDAEWGATDESWQPVRNRTPGWLGGQSVYCVTSPHGAIDIFLAVSGLDDWPACWTRAPDERTASGVAYRGLSDRDMLTCQEALEEDERKPERIRALREALGDGHGTGSTQGA